MTTEELNQVVDELNSNPTEFKAFVADKYRGVIDTSQAMQSVWTDQTLESLQKDEYWFEISDVHLDPLGNIDTSVSPHDRFVAILPSLNERRVIYRHAQ